MTTLVAALTDTTCGDACWRAREDVCRCLCGGANHGCLRTAGGVQLERTARILGSMYRLAAVGTYSEMRRALYDKADVIRQTEPKIPAGSKYYADMGYVIHDCQDNERGARFWVKSASKDQIARWPELTAARSGGRFVDCCMLWERV